MNNLFQNNYESENDRKLDTFWAAMATNKIHRLQPYNQ